ncbi:hypothetical protein PSHT_00806, partial [Puccinia striiformis]
TSPRFVLTPTSFDLTLTCEKQSLGWRVLWLDLHWIRQQTPPFLKGMIAELEPLFYQCQWCGVTYKKGEGTWGNLVKPSTMHPSSRRH